MGRTKSTREELVSAGESERMDGMIENEKSSAWKKRLKIKMHKTAACKASMTVEAAIVLPLFLLAVLSVLSVMDIIRFSAAMELELMKSAKELAVYVSVAKAASVTEEEEGSELGLPSGILSAGYAGAKIGQAFTEDDYEEAGIENGREGISEIYTLMKNDNNFVDLVFSYTAQPNFNFFSYSGYELVNRCRMRAWTGYDAGISEASEEERNVYVTETGTVYHLTETCTYLDLSILTTSRVEVEGLKNKYGSRYDACKSCSRGKLSDEALLFITTMGDSYHVSLSCSGLKRTVRVVPISEVSGMPACSRCGK